MAMATPHVCLALLIVLLSAYTPYGFAPQRRRSLLQPDSQHYHRCTNRATIRQTSWINIQNPSSDVHANYYRAKNNNNDDIDDKKYTRVEDGSPLGVAIVMIGSLIIFNGDETLPQDPASPSVWIVFATASIAAGLARLYRYNRDKNE